MREIGSNVFDIFTGLPVDGEILRKRLAEVVVLPCLADEEPASYKLGLEAIANAFQQGRLGQIHRGSRSGQGRVDVTPDGDNGHIAPDGPDDFYPPAA